MIAGGWWCPLGVGNRLRQWILPHIDSEILSDWSCSWVALRVMGGDQSAGFQFLVGGVKFYFAAIGWVTFSVAE